MKTLKTVLFLIAFTSALFLGYWFLMGCPSRIKDTPIMHQGEAIFPGSGATIYQGSKVGVVHNTGRGYVWKEVEE